MRKRKSREKSERAAQTLLLLRQPQKPPPPVSSPNRHSLLPTLSTICFSSLSSLYSFSSVPDSPQHKAATLPRETLAKATSGSGSGSDLYLRVANSEIVKNILRFCVLESLLIFLFFEFFIPDHKKDFKKIVIVLVIIGFVLLMCVMYFSWKWMAKRRGKKRTILIEEAGTLDSVYPSLQDALSKVSLEELLLFKFRTLADATDKFSDSSKLGKGGFGHVYKSQTDNFICYSFGFLSFTAPLYSQTSTSIPCVFHILRDFHLVADTNEVDTKLETGSHQNIGLDLAAISFSDIVTSRVKSSFSKSWSLLKYFKGSACFGLACRSCLG
ncbi:UNVERIFIED_CONTAM: hypothetical protein Scaly_2854500 [Sesamum calycinum]|uniref:Uncharacterized protein n=1 Tax=Sesamum calycinum TaxID=2727403 RepID=A0AAW2LHW6_9LAMI